MDKITEMLEMEIDTEIQNLSFLEDGSEEKARHVDGVEKLYRARADEKVEKIKLGIQLIGTIITGIAVIGGIAYKWTWTKRGFVFEQTGTFCSDTLKEIKKFQGFKIFK